MNGIEIQNFFSKKKITNFEQISMERCGRDKGARCKNYNYILEYTYYYLYFAAFFSGNWMKTNRGKNQGCLLAWFTVHYYHHVRHNQSNIFILLLLMWRTTVQYEKTNF